MLPLTEPLLVALVAIMPILLGLGLMRDSLRFRFTGEPLWFWEYIPAFWTVWGAYSLLVAAECGQRVISLCARHGETDVTLVATAITFIAIAALVLTSMFLLIVLPFKTPTWLYRSVSGRTLEPAQPAISPAWAFILRVAGTVFTVVALSSLFISAESMFNDRNAGLAFTVLGTCLLIQLLSGMTLLLCVSAARWLPGDKNIEQGNWLEVDPETLEAKVAFGTKLQFAFSAVLVLAVAVIRNSDMKAIGLGLMVFLAIVWIGWTILTWLASFDSAAVLRGRAIVGALQSQLPLAENIEKSASQFTGDSKLKLKLCAKQLTDGRPLFEAAQSAGLLSDSATNLLIASHSTPSTATVLSDQISSELKQLNDEARGQMSHQMTAYFWVVLSVMGIVLSFINYSIVPKFKKIFEDFGTELPDVTQLYLRITDQHPSFVILVALIPIWIVIGVHCFQFGTPGAARRLRHFLRRWVIQVETPDVLRCLAVATDEERAVAPVLRAMATGNFGEPMKVKLTNAAMAVRDGADVWESLSRLRIIHQNEAAAIAAAPLINGSATRGIAWSLRTLADLRDSHRSNRYRWAIAILQPTLTLGIGLVVAFCAVALFVPLVKIINDFS